MPSSAKVKEIVSTLVLVDVQNDFHPGGSLAIPTAKEDAARIARLILQHPTRITRVVATMDSHHPLHIAHPQFWVKGDDGTTHPDPFTLISSEDVDKGLWKPNPRVYIPRATIDGQVFAGGLEPVTINGVLDLQKYVVEYTKRLEGSGKFQLCIWPPHCLIGSPGHGLVDTVFTALLEWSHTTGRSVEWVLKGQNLLTESYSALEAEVPVDGATTFNQELQTSLQLSDQLIVCGQAMSHCVNYTLRSIVERWPKEELSKITLLTDCTSSVPGFETTGDAFQKDMSALGVQLKTSTTLFE